jgi:protein involved in ribonucleotide reduction
MGVCSKRDWSARQASSGSMCAMVTNSANSKFADAFFVAQSDVSRECGHGPFVCRA